MGDFEALDDRGRGAGQPGGVRQRPCSISVKREPVRKIGTPGHFAGHQGASCAKLT
jgi:hypothetical protein